MGEDKDEGENFSFSTSPSPLLPGGWLNVIL